MVRADEFIGKDINTCTVSGTVTTVELNTFNGGADYFTFFRITNREYRKHFFVQRGTTHVNIFACVMYDDGMVVNGRMLQMGDKVVVSGRLVMFPPKIGKNALFLLAERVVICGHKKVKE